MREIRNLDILSNKDFNFFKAKTKEAALSSCWTYNSSVSQNLSKDEFIAFLNLSKNKDLIIQKSDKENSVVTVDRHDYIKKMENIWSDQNKFTRVNLKDNILLNFAVIQEKRVDQVLKNLFDSNRMVGKKTGNC